MLGSGAPREPFVRLSVDEAKAKLDRDGKNIMLVDVREPAEYATKRIPGAVLIPVGSILSRIKELDATKEIVFVCAVGQRSALAAEMAAAMGYTRLYNIEGGTDGWAHKGYPIESGDHKKS
ncbi:MAG: rhodanese-like domain-containing protein [Chloroflexi bacterium]|nr:rhodanese-like domain-containing protein [Chloroflexota bacterium]